MSRWTYVNLNCNLIVTFREIVLCECFVSSYNLLVDGVYSTEFPLACYPVLLVFSSIVSASSVWTGRNIRPLL